MEKIKFPIFKNEMKLKFRLNYEIVDNLKNKNYER